MAFADRRLDPNRARFAIMAAAVHAALGLALLFGLAVDVPKQIAERLTLVTIRPAPPVKEAPPAPSPSPNRDRQDSPRNLKAEPKPVVAPPPKIEVPPPPIVAATVAGQGSAATAGASVVTRGRSTHGGTGYASGPAKADRRDDAAADTLCTRPVNPT